MKNDDSPAAVYERFKLEWMLAHGYTLQHLVAELEKLRGLPVFQLLSSGQEAADKLPAGKGIQHGVIGTDIAGGEMVQDHHHINVAGFCGLPAAVAPLESGKPDAVRKGLIQGSHIFFNKFSYFNHFR